MAVAGVPGLRLVRAGNPSPLTLDGTRTYIVGEREAAVIDPGPADPAHLDALSRALEGAKRARILLTHGHPDHAAGAEPLARRTGASVLSAAAGTLPAGTAVPTDAGELVALPTPGHTPDHLAFHWSAAGAVFCGDLLMGGMDTALVAAPEGDLGDYLRALEAVAALRPRLLLPAHGPPFTDPPAALERYRAHRRERQEQVLAALRGGARTEEAVVERVYPELEPRLAAAARAAVRAYLEHLRRIGVARRSGEEWETSGS